MFVILRSGFGDDRAASPQGEDLVLGLSSRASAATEGSRVCFWVVNCEIPRPKNSGLGMTTSCRPERSEATEGPALDSKRPQDRDSSGFAVRNDKMGVRSLVFARVTTLCFSRAKNTLRMTLPPASDSWIALDFLPGKSAKCSAIISATFLTYHVV